MSSASELEWSLISFAGGMRKEKEKKGGNKRKRWWEDEARLFEGGNYFEYFP